MKDIEDVKQMSDRDLNFELAILMGAEKDGGRPGLVKTGTRSHLPAQYTLSIFTAREVQAKAIELDETVYVGKLAALVLPGECSFVGSIVHFLQATPRQISEAAYITLIGDNK